MAWRFREGIIGLALLGLLLGASPAAAARPSRPRRATTSRAAHNRTPRHRAAAQAFRRQTGYPHGRPGYVVDHIIPLACGGKDEPSNMQWQSAADAKAKDKIERKGPGCR
jgi:hypothetical protein